MMNAQIIIEMVTPQMAEHWLSTNFEGQRHISETRVLKLAAEMIEGRWRLSGDAIIFLKGRLANGQHRLSAIIRAHKSAQFLVLKSNDIDMFKIVDCGKPRTVGDVLMVENSNIVASISRLVLQYDKGLLWRGGRWEGKTVGKIMMRGEIIDFANDNLNALSEIAKKVNLLYKKSSKILPTSISGSLVFIAARKNKEKAFRFIEEACNPHSGNPVARAIYDQLLQNKLSTKKIAPVIIFGLLIKAYNLYPDKGSPKFFKFTVDSEFPKID